MAISDDRRTPLRKDARRNRETLITAAREVCAERGVDAPLDEIARRAGVGNATLYRHFASRAELIEAVFRDSLTPLLRAAEEARAHPDPWAGLTAYMDRVFTLLAADRGANDLMTTGIQGVPTLEALHEGHRHTLDVLLRRAQQQAAVRADIGVEDLLFLLTALGRAVPAVPDTWRRYLALLLDALRPGAAHPLPAPPPGPGRFGAALRQSGPAPRTGTGPDRPTR
ncbi:helix-turn-helix domain-containing protein [Streptomyces blastmyceticus]|uniref:Helix-turn-helix domain-containing protein n=1 Tax=Streptomyces blastmyceticus TaxID=68180 RepID=A0ABP3HPD0_9ACTN